MNFAFYIKRLGTVVLLTFALLLPAIYNRFPLITPDTTAYIKHAFDVQLPSDRSPFYGVFVGICSMWKWLWGPVIVQSALLAFLLCKLTMAVLQTTKQQIITWVTLIIGLLTGAGAITSYIMPDVFTAIMLLAGIIYLIDNAQPKALRP